MRFDLDRLPTDPVLLQKMLREIAEVMELERAELGAAKQTVKAQGLTIEKLEHRLARLLRVQFGRSSEKMDIAQLRLMFEDVDAPAPANDDATMASGAKRSEEHTSELQSLMRISYAVFCLKKKSTTNIIVQLQYIH